MVPFAIRWGEDSLIVLQDNIWSDLSCGSRMVIVPIFTVAGLLFCATLIFFMRHINNWIQGGQQLTYSWIKSRATIALITVATVSIGLVTAVSPNVTRYATNGSVLVESGCHATTIYTKRIPLDQASITYKRSERRRGYDGHSLLVKGSGYIVTLNLAHQKNYSVLARIAPGPMEQFARALREENQNVPAPLRNLLKRNNT